MTMNSVPVVTLTTGLRVANFSSPHPFGFTDGSKLEACSPERAKTLMLRAEEKEVLSSCGRYTDIDLESRLSDVVYDALVALDKDDTIDIVIVPFPVLSAAKDAGHNFGKIRTIRCADRVTKLNHHDRFCV